MCNYTCFRWNCGSTDSKCEPLETILTDSHQTTFPNSKCSHRYLSEKLVETLCPASQPPTKAACEIISSDLPCPKCLVSIDKATIEPLMAYSQEAASAYMDCMRGLSNFSLAMREELKKLCTKYDELPLDLRTHDRLDDLNHEHMKLVENQPCALKDTFQTKTSELQMLTAVMITQLDLGHDIPGDEVLHAMGLLIQCETVMLDFWELLKTLESAIITREILGYLQSAEASGMSWCTSGEILG